MATNAETIRSKEAISALEGQLSIENANLTATQQRITAISAALSVLQDGYESDLNAINEAVSAKLEAAKQALN